MATVGRNEPCPCGSGKRYKDCHGALRDPDGMPASRMPPGSADHQQRMFAALDAQKAARLTEAATLYQSVLDGEPDNFDAMHMLGVIKFELGELQQAESLLLRAIAVNPGVAAAYTNLRLIRHDASPRSCAPVAVAASGCGRPIATSMCP
jgi:tetratricopeptide (TPR) repeat protein